MRALLLLASLILTTVACGRESAASGASAGRLEPRGQLAFSCGADCAYIGDAVHVGEGCVASVRGRTRLVRADGSVLASDAWSLEPGHTLAARDTFQYRHCCFDPTTVAAMAGYRTEIWWEDVPCAEKTASEVVTWHSFPQRQPLADREPADSAGERLSAGPG